MNEHSCITFERKVDWKLIIQKSFNFHLHLFTFAFLLLSESEEEELTDEEESKVAADDESLSAAIRYQVFEFNRENVIIKILFKVQNLNFDKAIVIYAEFRFVIQISVHSFLIKLYNM